MSISSTLRGILLGVLVIPAATQAQTLISLPSPDSGAYHAIREYQKAIGSSAALYNGFQYNELHIRHNDIGHPYFLSDDWVTGAIQYDGQYYTKVDMMYDILNNKVVVGNSSGYANLELIWDKVQHFSMAGHVFVKLSGDSTAEYVMRPGLYDVLYDGDVKVYALRKKQIQKKLESGVDLKVFKEQNTYFIYKAGSYFRVKTRPSVLRVLRDQKSSLRRQLAKNKIPFNKNRELTITSMARFYEESVKQK